MTLKMKGKNSRMIVVSKEKMDEACNLICDKINDLPQEAAKKWYEYFEKFE